MKKALITGITGQDGSYLAEFLLKQGYEVHGLVRRSSEQGDRLKRLLGHPDIQLHYGLIDNYASVLDVIEKTCPDECYHLAAQSDVALSFKDPFGTKQINSWGTAYILSAIKERCPNCKFYFAGSSEMFGGMPGTAPQNEHTPFHPRSPYAISKVDGFHETRHYRERDSIFACSGILFNHESPRRGPDFVTRKISLAVARIKVGLQNKLFLGNLDTSRDWGFAEDYVIAMWLMLQQDRPDDYVIATGKTHTVKEFANLAFQEANLDWQKYVEIDEKLYRPTEVKELCGDYSKAKRILGWEPRVKFSELVKMMVRSDLALYRKQSKTY